jgi:hypothetical protein
VSTVRSAMLCALLDITIKDVKTQENVVYDAIRDKQLQEISRALSYLNEARSLISRYPEADHYREAYHLLLTAKTAAPLTSLAMDELSGMVRLFAL